MQLHRRAKEIRGDGEAEVTLIGQASPRHAAHFRKRQKIDLPVLADESRISYELAGARRAGVAGLIGPKVVAKSILKSARSGEMQGRPVGDVAQLGGAMVIRPGGSIAWSHMSRDASDSAVIEEIAAAVASARDDAG